VGARRLFLGLDVGTGGTKGLAIDERGRVLARAAQGHGLIEGLPEGAAEQHPQTWIEAAGAVARRLWAELAPRAGELAGLGVSGQQHGLVALDERGQVVRPAKLWCDTSTAAEAEELSRRLGRAVPCGFTAPKVLWLQRREPRHWARTRWVLLPHEYVNLRLCGERAAEFGDASGTGWFDVVARTWDRAALEALEGLAGRLPRLLAPGDSAGSLTPEGARALGLDGSFAGVPVAAGGGDNMMSAIGAGATAQGVCVASLGTSATVFAHSDAPLLDPRGEIAAFCGSGGGWLPLLCTMNATAVLHEVAQAFGADLEELCERAGRVPPLARGVRFLPFLVGERVPDLPLARGVLEGLAPGSLRGEVVMRAALEGVTFNLALGVARLRELGLSVERLRAVGGGARNRLWLELIAASLAVNVERCDEAETAALGAALQARWTVERLHGSRASLHESAQDAVARTAETVEAEADLARACAGGLAEFAQARRRHFGA
jgi:xylulokinase